jgi:hypothetical protein
MIANAATVIDPDPDPAAAITTDVAQTPAPEVDPVVKMRNIKGADASSEVTRLLLVDDTLSAGGIGMIGIVAIKLLAYIFNTLARRWRS